ncbi:glycosyltransferase family 4 protein [Gordonia sp. NPDC003376]
MRITHLVNELVDTGNGIVNVAVDLACTQAADGHEVHVVSRGGEFVSLVERFGVVHHTVEMSSHPRRLRHTRVELDRILDGTHPDIVHSHTLTPAALAFWSKLRTRGGAPRPRLITTVHNEYQRGAALMGAADMTVSVSAAVDDAMATRHIPARRRRVVHNGVLGSPRRRPVSEIDPVEVDGRMILALGAVSHRKGPDLLVAAFEGLADEYPDVSLWFVGNHDWPELVARARRARHGDRIHFPGLDREPTKYLKAATMLVLPSRRDPFPLVLLEAKETGTPVIGTDVDGIPEALDHGESGLLVPADDAAGLEKAIRHLLDSDSARAELVAHADAGLERYTVRRMTDDYVDIYLDQVALGSV